METTIVQLTLLFLPMPLDIFNILGLCWIYTSKSKRERERRNYSIQNCRMQNIWYAFVALMKSINLMESVLYLCSNVCLTMAMAIESDFVCVHVRTEVFFFFLFIAFSYFWRTICIAFDDTPCCLCYIFPSILPCAWIWNIL